jgi:hypothetical protein
MREFRGHEFEYRHRWHYWKRGICTAPNPYLYRVWSRYKAIGTNEGVSLICTGWNTRYKWQHICTGESHALVQMKFLVPTSAFPSFFLFLLFFLFSFSSHHNLNPVQILNTSQISKHLTRSLKIQSNKIYSNSHLKSQDSQQISNHNLHKSHKHHIDLTISYISQDHRNF